MISLNPSPTPDPLLLCLRGKEPQMIVTHAFILQHMKPVMMYTDDTRTASSNVLHVIMASGHGNNLVGDGWWETGYAHSP